MVLSTPGCLGWGGRRTLASEVEAGPAVTGPVCAGDCGVASDGSCLPGWAWRRPCELTFTAACSLLPSGPNQRLWRTADPRGGCGLASCWCWPLRLTYLRLGTLGATGCCCGLRGQTARMAGGTSTCPALWGRRGCT
ncbi:hypothetical protein NDU88_002762 [Pleurodeles waltl]|uniref:Uncharacterized protein n=1 Tax=Pleurodeles waltl TaxID=8319 RepID=A0AAV7RCD3_PLEWA|nr:hypothetical protein NDU88_002762 [Pleurodeles waltl]